MMLAPGANAADVLNLDVENRALRFGSDSTALPEVILARPLIIR
jgi:hypothetical protein